jgi:hypothetical protein
MYTSIQRRMVGHGGLMLLIAMLAGVGLLISLLGGLELTPGQILPIPIVGDSQTWVRIHIGGMLNAFLVFLVALLLPVLAFSEKASRRIAWVFICTGWANTLFYWAGLAASNRALSFGPNRFGPPNLASAIGLAPALIFVVISLIAVAALTLRAFATPAPE